MLGLFAAYQVVTTPPRQVPEDGYIVDLHVHVAGIGAGDSGCFISDSMTDSFKFPIYLWAFGVNEEELNNKGDAVVVQKVHEAVASSLSVDAAVVLAMDGVIVDGELDRERTQVYVPNEYLAETVKPYDNLFFGASVNPYRPDALKRLQWAKDHGAVLVKWIPAIMHIDPADERIIPFYRKLIELGLPLLSHAGQERSFGEANDELGDPHRLRLPLELGVTVIAAHIATTGENDGEDNFERLLPMFDEFPNLYADISSLTQLNKLGFLKRALQHDEMIDQLVYGSDFPLQFFPLVSPWYQIGHVSFAQLWHIFKLDNKWQRDVALKRALGVPATIFERSASLLKLGTKRSDTIALSAPKQFSTTSINGIP